MNDWPWSWHALSTDQNGFFTLICCFNGRFPTSWKMACTSFSACRYYPSHLLMPLLLFLLVRTSSFTLISFLTFLFCSTLQAELPVCSRHCAYKLPLLTEIPNYSNVHLSCLWNAVCFKIFFHLSLGRGWYEDDYVLFLTLHSPSQCFHCVTQACL